MDIRDLKSAWNAYSSMELSKHQLKKEAIRDLMKARTRTMVSRIERNIQIGIVILLVYIAYVIFDDIYLSKLLLKDPVKYPVWLIPLDVISNLLIVTTYLVFIYRYLKVKRSFSSDNELHDLLSGIIRTLKTYRRMFYLAVVILLINVVVSFIAGICLGIKIKTDALGVGGHLPLSKILIICLIGVVILVPLVSLSFLLLRWGFNKLYGRYLSRLNDTLLELEESDESEVGE